MALHLDVKVGECVRIGDAEITVVEKSGKGTIRLQIDADKEQYPVDLIDKSRVKRIWDGPPIYITE